MLSSDQNLERLVEVDEGVAVCTEAVEAEEEGVTGSSPEGAGDVATPSGGAEAGRGECGSESEAEDVGRGIVA